MSVKIVYGDMVESYKNSELDAYAHQTNCFCRMGRGIAPLLAAANQEVRNVDNSTEEGSKGKMGWFSRTNSTPFVYNVYGQYHWRKYQVVKGRNTDYQALGDGLFKVMEDLHKYQWENDIKRQITLGIPLIGCGLAGGDWGGVVLPMIEDIFSNCGVDVTVFILK